MLPLHPERVKELQSQTQLAGQLGNQPQNSLAAQRDGAAAGLQSEANVTIPTEESIAVGSASSGVQGLETQGPAQIRIGDGLEHQDSVHSVGKKHLSVQGKELSESGLNSALPQVLRTH